MPDPEPEVPVEMEVVDSNHIDRNLTSGSDEMNNLSQQHSAGSSAGAAAAVEDDIEYYTLSGVRPYFALVLSKTHLSPCYQLYIPSKMVDKLPTVKKMIPMDLTSCGKRWRACYRGDVTVKRFDASGWKGFAEDNDLKVGDCCFFELMECSASKIEFKVIIIRNELTLDAGGAAAGAEQGGGSNLH